ncbi:MAG: PHP domain-containing protein [Clostridia bacterium]
MKYDLHVHSTYSDGVKTPMHLGEEAVEAGLGGFALTDHDTIAGWEEIPSVERTYPVTVFPGVELSTEWEGRDVHILGYCMTDMEPFQKKLAELAACREQRIARIVEKCNDLGLSVSFDEVRSLAGEGTVGRPHVAAVLVKNGYAKDNQTAFDRYLNRGKPAYVERQRFSPMEAVKLIKNCGGYAVLAHPGLDRAIDFLDLLVPCGLDGIEVYHSSHHSVNSAKFASIAEARHLSVCGGSDYHGHSDRTHGNIGSVALEETELPVFLSEYLKEHRKNVERV